MPNAFNGIHQRDRQATRAVPVSFQYVKCDSLRRFLSDARHTTQTIDQSNKKR
jgi:hypothetical protein